ncbi:hypothetical protein Tco_0404746 [Tanacetum coccineum]
MNLSQGTGSGSGPRRQDTMGDTIAQTRFENVSNTSNDSLLAGVNTPRSDEDGFMLKMRFMWLKGQIVLLSSYTAGEIFYYCRVLRQSTTTNKDKGKGIMEEPEKPTKKKIKLGMMRKLLKISSSNASGTIRKEEDRIEGKEKKKAHCFMEDNMQAMIDVDYQMAQQMQAEEQEKLSIKEKSKLFKLFDKAMKRVNTFVDMDTELVEGSKVRAEGSKKRAGEELMQESAKKQKVHNDTKEDDTEETELKDCLEIITDEEEITIDVVPLAVKSPLIMYMVFNKMLRSFDREDLDTLYKLVKARYRSTRPVGEDRVLWGDLMTTFEPNVEDDIWRNQQEYRLLSWKLYDSCGVHCLMTNSMHIYMLVEKKYPLPPITLSKM